MPIMYIVITIYNLAGHKLTCSCHCMHSILAIASAVTADAREQTEHFTETRNALFRGCGWLDNNISKLSFWSLPGFVCLVDFSTRVHRRTVRVLFSSLLAMIGLTLLAFMVFRRGLLGLIYHCVCVSTSHQGIHHQDLFFIIYFVKWSRWGG